METGAAIQWKPWDDKTFRQAKETGKPVFLSISASWCHWCHVMDEESFTHPEVIRRLNSDFIPVRVDSDKRPDINNRYNMGGWPTVAILNPDGKIRVGGTYLPTGELLAMLTASPVQPERGQPRPQKQKAPTLSTTPSLDDGIVEKVAGFLERAYDRNFGGFGTAPKFPQPWAIEMAFQLHLRTGENQWLEMATLSLDHMREGEIYDHVDGGFFRYATRDDWESPHYEKLLEVNAQVLSLYLKAHLLTGAATYRATAQGLLDYLMIHLAVPGTVWFGGSQTADREYYHLPEEERVVAESPSLDRTRYTDRNAMAVSGLLMAGHILGDSGVREAGLKIIEVLWEHGHRPGEGMFHYDDGEPSLMGHLSDQVYMIQALADAFEVTGAGSYLNRAERLTKVINDRLWDSRHFGYWDLPEESEAQRTLIVRIKPFTENAIAAMALTRLHYLTGIEEYRLRAQSLLSYLATVFPPYKHYAAPFGLAVARFLDPPHLVTVAGQRNDARWTELVEAANRVKSIWKVVLPLDTRENESRIKELGYPRTDRPLAYLCVGKTCLAPISRPEDLASAHVRSSENHS